MSLMAAFRAAVRSWGREGSSVVWGCSASHLIKEVRLHLELGIGCFVLVPSPPSAVCLLCDLRQVPFPLWAYKDCTFIQSVFGFSGNSGRCVQKGAVSLGSSAVLTLQNLLTTVEVMAQL